jgi:hypothetical protein
VLRLRPAFPDWLSTITLANLQVGEATTDICVRRNPNCEYTLEVTHQQGPLEVSLAPTDEPLAVPDVT